MHFPQRTLLATSLALLLLTAVAACAQTPAPAPSQPGRPSPQVEQNPVDSRPAYDPDREKPGRKKVDRPQAPPHTTQGRPIVQRAVDVPSRNAYGTAVAEDDHFGSAYISVDSWIYAAVLRLYSMGYMHEMYLSMRPWTRRAVLHQLMESEADVIADRNEEAMETFAVLKKEFESEKNSIGTVYGVESVYTRLGGNSGAVLRDSYHLGQSYVNDYGRPYGEGFNAINGFSAAIEKGRFTLHVRGEYQHAAGADGYGLDLVNILSGRDGIPYTGYNAPADTMPYGPIGARNQVRWIDAYVSAHLLNHEISFGKIDNWLGPNRGGAMAWSNNADNVYAFRINRVEPLHIPLLSRLLGPVRYDFFVGSLQGHTYPNSPYVHDTMFSFAPTQNFQFAFQRTVIWGGKGHAPVNLHTFLKSFFSLDDTDAATKFSVNDPGARFSDFSFSYRLPFLRKWATLTADTFTHDDVTPISAPRRAAFRTGIYMPQVPGIPKLEARVEAAVTDPKVANSLYGGFMFIETIQRQGTTNKDFLFTDPTGREGKGGNAWLTYHLSPTEIIEVEYRRKKTAKDFVPGGTTQSTFTFGATKKIGRDVDVNAQLSIEQWKAPVYRSGSQTLTTATLGITWHPGLKAKEQ